jgi:uncharacterized membrane protein
MTMKPKSKLKAKKAMAYDMVIGGSFELALGITLCVIYASQQSAIATITLFLSTFIAIILMVAGVSLIALRHRLHRREAL